MTKVEPMNPQLQTKLPNVSQAFFAQHSPTSHLCTKILRFHFQIDFQSFGSLPSYLSSSFLNFFDNLTLQVWSMIVKIG